MADNRSNTTLTAFFETLKNDPFAKTLLYPEVPRFYTWNLWRKTFSRRKQGIVVPGTDIKASDALGHVYTIHPRNAECFYLRMLLHTVKRPTSFEDLRTINNEICQTYREACQKYGLLEDDENWESTLSDAALTGSPSQLRSLLAIILITCALSNSNGLCETYKDSLSEDFLHRERCASNNLELTYTHQVHNLALIGLKKDKCISINNKSLKDLGLPSLTREVIDILDRDILRETTYDTNVLKAFLEVNKPQLIPDQKNCF